MNPHHSQLPALICSPVGDGGSGDKDISPGCNETDPLYVLADGQSSDHGPGLIVECVIKAALAIASLWAATIAACLESFLIFLYSRPF